MICCWTDEQHHGIYLIIWRTELCFGKGNMTWYQNNTRHFSMKILHLTFTMCFLFYDRLLCCNEAILVSHQFLGLLLLKSSEPAMGNSLKSVLFDTVSGEVFLLRIWQYFFLLKSGRNYSETDSRHDSYFARWSPHSKNLGCSQCKWTGRIMCTRCCLAFRRVNC